MFNPTLLFKIYAKIRAAKINNLQSTTQQKKELFKLLRFAKDTKFGKEHQFNTIKSVEDYQQRIPLRTYEDFWKDYWKQNFPVIENITWPGKIPRFCVSSGTTSGTTKYLPLSDEMMKSNTKAGIDILVHHITNHPESNLFNGKSFFLGGSTEFVEEAPGIHSGDLSGMATKSLPWYIKPFYFPPLTLTKITKWEEKIQRFAEESLKENLKLISGVPAWMLIYFNKLFELRPEAEGKLENIFPELELLVHGGVNFLPYEKQFRALTEGSQIDFREVYPASEGFIAIADRKSGEGLKMNLDHGLFYEFIPLEELHSANPTRHWIGNIEKDINYAIALTSCAGLWSYLIGDTVKFIDTKTPRLLITGRTSYYLSAFGEHLIADEIEDAVSTAANDINYSVTDYSVGAVFPHSTEELGGHIYIIEFKEGMPQEAELKRFTNVLDRKLCERNEDYEAHRSDGFGLKAPQIKTVLPGTFAAWMKSRGKLGGQNKVPRIITKDDLLQNLIEFCQ